MHMGFVVGSQRVGEDLLKILVMLVVLEPCKQAHNIIADKSFKNIRR